MTSTKTYPYTPGEEVKKQEQYPVNAIVVPTTRNNANDNNYPTATPVTNPHPPQQQQYGAQVSKPKYIQVNSRRPVMLTSCPSCAAENVQTRTRTKGTGTTWVCVGAGVFIFWPLCWVPLCIKPMKQTNHYCQNCNKKVGRVKPFQ